MADKLNGIIISEVLADNPPQGGFDTDGDGSANKSDEFIEFQNTTGFPISLSGYQVWSDYHGLLYTFGATATIDPYDTAVVIGEYSGTAPAGFYDAGLGNNQDFLRDGEGSKFDTIYLVDPSGNFIAFSYGDPPQPASPPAGFPGTNQIGAGESINSGAPNGTAFARNADGNFEETQPPTPGTPGVACYAAGTMIATPAGPRAIETLQAGDAVLTADGTTAPVRFVLFQSETFLGPDAARPVQIKAHALGPGRPAQDLVVSSNHRILVGGQGQLTGLFPEQVFVPAKALTDLPRIRVMQGKRRVAWVHILLPSHHIITANGCQSESLFPGPVTLPMLPRGEQRRLTMGATASRWATTVRPSLTVAQARAIVAAGLAHRQGARRPATVPHLRLVSG